MRRLQLVWILLLLSCFHSVAQTPTIEERLHIERDSPDDVSSESFIYKGGESVHFKTNQANATQYLAIPEGSHFMHAFIDENMITSAPTGTPYSESDFDTHTIDPSLPVGYTPGSHGVSPTGAATYSIPIQLPPGTNGMVPSLSINYSSQSGNGILGMGWSLGGLSAITRVPKTIYHDEETEEVQLDGTDVFALDGNRLIMLNASSTYGANGTEYGTESETFSLVTSYGQYSGNASGPKWWEVKTKEGLTIQYGCPEESGPMTNSRFWDNYGHTVIAYQVNKITDQFGNYVEFEYINSDRQSRISQIRYTGNSNAGIDPYNIIQFHYQEREDKSEMFIAGSSIKSNVLLRKISIVADGSHFKNYEFEYGHDFYSTLKSVNEYGATGGQVNPTVFKYGEGSNQLLRTLHEELPNMSNVSVIPGDYTGDGLTDLMILRINQRQEEELHELCEQAFDQEPGNSCFLDEDLDADPPNNYLPTNNLQTHHCQCWYDQLDGHDANGDGHDDYQWWNYQEVSGPTVTTNYVDVDIELYKMSEPNGQFTFVDDLTLTSTAESVGPFLKRASHLGMSNTGVRDKLVLTGTSMPDGNDGDISILAFVEFSGGQLTPSQFKLDQYAGPQDVFPNQTSSDDKRIFVGNFLGFSTDEIVTVLTTGAGTAAYIYRNGDFYPLGLGGSDCEFLIGADEISQVDFDGDGKVDILATEGGLSKVYEFSGSLITPSCNVASSGSFPGNHHGSSHFGDFNGDGKTDILFVDGNADWHISYSTGIDFRQVPFQFVHESGQNIHVADFNGDGVTDILRMTILGEDLYCLNGLFDNSGVSYRHSHSEEGMFIVSNFLGEFNGDGRADILSMIMDGPHLDDPLLTFCFNPNASEFQLHGAVDGFGKKAGFSYSWLTKPDIYEMSSSTHSKTLNVRPGLQVVSNSYVSDGVGGLNTLLYSYRGLKRHREGRGLLGFGAVFMENPSLDRKTSSIYKLDDSYWIRHLESKMVKTLAESDVENYTKEAEIIPIPGGQRFWPKTVKETFTNNITQFITTKEYLTFDIDGNVTEQKITQGSDITTITRTFTSFSNWPFLARLDDESVTVQNQWDTDSRSVDYLYNSNGFLVSRQSDPGSAKEVTNLYEQDVFGNVKKVTTAAPSVPWRVNEFEYDSKGRFAIRTTNALNQEATASYDNRWGKPTSVTDIIGHTSSFQYDEFGRTISSTDALGISTSTEYFWDSGTQGALYYVEMTASGIPPVKNWFDMFERGVKTETEGLSEVISTSKAYNSLGQLATSVDVHGSTGGIEKTYGYNPNHQLASVSSPAGTTSYLYAPDGSEYKTTISSPLGVSHKWQDASGKFVKSNDAAEDMLRFEYDATGGVSVTKFDSETDPIVTMGYDEWGFQTSLDDPNAGESSYEYNALGELVQQTVNGYQFDMTYDEAGRILTKTGPVVQYDSDGRLQVDGLFKPVTQLGTTTHQYVTDNNGLNQIKKIIAPNGISSEYSYDEFGQVLTETELVEGQEFTTSYSYDSFGRVHTVTHPSGVTVTNGYDNNGFLTTVNADGTDVFVAGEANAYGQLTNYTLGNGITTERTYDEFGRPEDTYTVGEDVFEYYTVFDQATGNLQMRSNVLNGLEEDFIYDGLNRLDESSVYGSTIEQDVNYDANGNITFKSDAGTYDYWPDKPNAIKSVTNLVGNDQQDISLVLQEFSYTTEGRRIGMIREDPYQATFVYGTDNQRRKMLLEKKDGASGEYTPYMTRYYHGSYERVIKHATQNDPEVVYELTYVNAGDGLCAIHVITDGNSGELYYVYKDHLGSILKLTKHDVTQEWEQSFDAWGRYRDPSTWEVLNSDPSEGGVFTNGAVNMPEWFNLGFTGHEHMREFDLINMNGRLYDPISGRMLSADNYVQEQHYSQSYNRYSYAFNNPLKYTDPSGEVAWAPIAIGAALGAYFGGVSANGGDLTPWMAGSGDSHWAFDSGTTWGYMIGGAAVGAASAYVGNVVATSGMPFANTASTISSSMVNSLGMYAVTGGKSDISISFGFGSYNFSQAEFGYLGKKGNSPLQNVGYSLGLMANLSDGLAGLNPADIELRTENEGRDFHPKYGDPIGHIQLNTSKGETLVDWGPNGRIAPGKNSLTAWRTGTNDYKNGPMAFDKMKWDPVRIQGVNVKRLSQYSPPGKFNLVLNNCVQNASRALNMSGVFNVGIHPYIFHAQMYLRSIGVRPMLFSHYLIQN